MSLHWQRQYNSNQLLCHKTCPCYSTQIYQYLLHRREQYIKLNNVIYVHYKILIWYMRIMSSGNTSSWMAVTKLLSHQIVLSPLSCADAHRSPQHWHWTDFSVNWIWTKQPEHEHFYLSHSGCASFQQEHMHTGATTAQSLATVLPLAQCDGVVQRGASACWAESSKKSWKQF